MPFNKSVCRFAAAVGGKVRRIMPRKVLINVMLALAVLLTLSGCYQEKIYSLTPRSKSIDLPFLMVEKGDAVANVILFPGGNGYLGLGKYGALRQKKNSFLVRSRKFFSQQGMNVIIYDMPSDVTINSVPYRLSDNQVHDVRTLITHLKEKNGLPVWLVGITRGTLSVVHTALSLGEDTDGIVLASPWNEVANMDLAELTVPVLLLYHEKDECKDTPPETSRAIHAEMTTAKKAVIRSFSDGWAPKSDPCFVFSPHDYFGIENKVVQVMTDFIKQN